MYIPPIEFVKVNGTYFFKCVSQDNLKPTEEEVLPVGPCEPIFVRLSVLSSKSMHLVNTGCKNSFFFHLVLSTVDAGQKQTNNGDQIASPLFAKGLGRLYTIFHETDIPVCINKNK